MIMSKETIYISSDGLYAEFPKKHSFSINIFKYKLINNLMYTFYILIEIIKLLSKFENLKLNVHSMRNTNGKPILFLQLRKS